MLKAILSKLKPFLEHFNYIWIKILNLIILSYLRMRKIFLGKYLIKLGNGIIMGKKQ